MVRAPVDHGDKTARSVPSNGRPRSRRPPIAKRLPQAITEQLRRAVSDTGGVTASMTEELDQRWSIQRRFDVSRRQLRNYLTKLQGEKGLEKPEASPRHLRENERNWQEKLRTHRHRQASVASILDATFGRFADSHPELWDRRAYWMLVGLVYERIATNEADLSTEELVALAKVLAEARRIEVRLHERGPSKENEESVTVGEGDLPVRFADVVRQVYGTNVAQGNGRPGAVGSSESGPNSGCDSPSGSDSDCGGSGDGVAAES